MDKGFDLKSYLPDYLRAYKEISETLSAEEPEFKIALALIHRVLNNAFISNADEYGISRFEKLLGIISSKDDTLEMRRIKALSLWAVYKNQFTYKWLVEWLRVSCGIGDALKLPELNGYSLSIYLPMDSDWQHILNHVNEIVPANIVINPNITMPKHKLKIVVGTTVRTVKKQILKVEGWESIVRFLVDENDALLVDENGLRLTDD